MFSQRLSRRPLRLVTLPRFSFSFSLSLSSSSSFTTFLSSRRAFRILPSPHPQPVRLTRKTLTSLSPRPVSSAPLTSPIVAHHLLLVAGLVFSIVVVGGLTRLTESGLSITEWNLISGVLPPLTDCAWETEFAKYKRTPEYKILNQSMDLDAFKTIYNWEWAHRFLGRLIGLSFLAPLPFFFQAGKVQGRSVKAGLTVIGALIGAQGALGWYMVQSGLDQAELDSRDGVPRVSQYRLAAHLAMAFAVYATSLRLAGGILRDWKLAIEAEASGGASSVVDSVRLLEGKVPVQARKAITVLTALVFLTAVSGAFVAGLDAGLVYNTFPLMGDRLIPPASELFAPAYTARNGGQPGWIRNIFENPTTVQFDHRLLASLTFVSTGSLFVYISRYRHLLPASTLTWVRAMMGMVSVQLGLGISTLVYMVPTALAAAHQAGSLVLLSLTLGAGLSLRRPSQANQFLQHILHPRAPFTSASKIAS